MVEGLTPEVMIEKIKTHDEEAKKLRNALIEEHFGFVVHTISKVTGRYVEIENSEELSIGLLAFNEAIDRFDSSKEAAFLTYAHLVITSRIRDYFKKGNNESVVSIDDIKEEGLQHLSNVYEDGSNEIAAEIQQWESILIKFGFDLETLVDETPKHIDTKNNAIALSEQISAEEDVVHKIYEKYRLPIAMIVLRFNTTKKVVKHSKRFIIATVVVLTKNFKMIYQWIYRNKKGGSSC